MAPRSLSKRQRDELNKINALLRRVCIGFKPPENITVSEWADKYRILSSENSAEAGRWRTSRVPYMKEVMDAWTDPRVREIAVVASSQVSKSESMLNILGYIIDQDPGSVLWVTPTLDMGEDFSKRRISPMIRDTKVLTDKVADSKSRSSKNTIFRKMFPGGMLTIVGTNSAKALSSTPARYVLGDEVDRWTKDVEGEGDPWLLLKARTATFYNAKMIQVSTPTVKGSSMIEKAFNRGTRERWCVQCPECGEYSFITFNTIRFKHRTIVEGKEKTYVVDSVEWACPECGCAVDEYTVKHQPMKWIAENPEAIKNGTRSFWINGFYSPWLTWKDIITSFLYAKDDPEKLKTVFNTLFGQLWEDRGELPGEEELASRAEDYGAELPEGVLCLTMGVDTQDNRLEYEVVGYGLCEENWGIQRGFIMGRPSEPETWEKLDGVIDRVWTFQNGRGLRISLVFVDSGGHYTQEVYENCAARINRRVFAIKGSNQSDAPFVAPPKRVDYLVDGRKGKAWLYMIGVDSGKAHIMSGLKVEGDGARKSHFPLDPERQYDRDFYNGLLSETMHFDGKRWRWEKLPGHNRNEALDCRDYANAAFKVLHPNLERIQKKLMEPAGGEAAPEKPKKRKKRRVRHVDLDGGFE